MQLKMKHELLYHDNNITAVGAIDQSPITDSKDVKEGVIVPHRQSLREVKLFVEQRDCEGNVINTVSLWISASAIMSIAKLIQHTNESTVNAPYCSNLPF
jgi:hypothetical protein